MAHLPDNYLTLLPRLPTPEQEKRSQTLMCDRFFTLPRIVECFISRANKELPSGWHVQPWTINRAVTIFHDGSPVKVIDYEALEGGYIVKMLDLVNGLASCSSKKP